MADPVHKGYRLEGRVQGVGFRWWTRREAARRRIDGTVRNCPDGSVEVHLRGPADEVSELEALLRNGPPEAEVRELTEIAPKPVEEGFEILH